MRPAAGARGAGASASAASAAASSAAAAGANGAADERSPLVGGHDVEEGLDATKTAKLQKAGAVPGHSTRPSAVSRVARALKVRSGTARVVLAAAVSLAWMASSNALIIVNKHILKDLKFP